MASVIFSADYKDEGKIETFYKQMLEVRKDAMESGIGHPDGSGFRIGSLLKGWNGHREEISFAVQSWDEFRSKLETFATNFHNKHKFEGIRTIGLDKILVQ